MGIRNLIITNTNQDGRLSHNPSWGFVTIVVFFECLKMASHNPSWGFVTMSPHYSIQSA